MDRSQHEASPKALTGGEWVQTRGIWHWKPTRHHKHLDDDLPGRRITLKANRETP